MVNIITEPKPYWILGRWAEEFQKRIPNSRIIDNPERNGINIYINYALFKEKTKLDIGIFTHREMEGSQKEKFDSAASKMDWCFAQSQPTLNKLPQNKASIISIGVGDQFIKRLKIGIIGREYDYTKRKRMYWIPRLKKDLPEIDFIITDGGVDYEDMRSVYENIDYYLQLADNEGGSMPILESLAMGVPSVAQKGVGWANEYATLLYNDYGDLIRILRGLIYKGDLWETGAKQIITKIKELTNEI